MNKLTTTLAAVALMAATFLASGCVSAQGDKTDAEYAAYEAGFLLGEVHIVTKPFQHGQVKEIMDMVFDFVATNPDDTGDALDRLVYYQINRLYADDTQEERDMLYGLYRLAKGRVSRQLEIDGGSSVLEVVSQFRQGLSDATGIVFDGVPQIPPPPAPAKDGEAVVDDITALLDSMEASAAE